MASWHIERYWPTGERIDVFTAMHTLNATRVVNDIGKLAFSLPYCPRFSESLEKGQQLTLWRNGNQQFNTRYLIQDWRPVTRGNAKLLEVMAVDLNWLASTRIIAYAAKSAQAEKTAPVDDLMKAVMRENFGDLAPTDRQIEGLHIMPDEGQGESITKGFAWRNVLTVLQELADGTQNDPTRIFWDLHGETVGNVIFNTYAGFIGEDRRASSPNFVPVGEQFGNLKEASVTWLTSGEATAVYAGGQGTETDRYVATAIDDKRIEKSAPFGRVEVFHDARNTDNNANVDEEARQKLSEKRPKIKLEGQLAQTEGFLFDRDFRWGDYLTVEAKGITMDCHTSAIGVSVNSNGEERIDVRLEGELTL